MTSGSANHQIGFKRWTGLDWRTRLANVNMILFKEILWDNKVNYLGYYKCLHVEFMENKLEIYV